MKKSGAILIFLSFICLAFTIEDIGPSKFLILNKLKEYNTNKFPEKIYVHTDKAIYSAGEDIWFSAYLVNGVTHQESSKSSVVYVELLNEQGTILSERMLFAESISVHGDFKLPLDLQDGNYTLRAYTNYMQNQPKAFFFEKEIPVYALYARETTDENIQDIAENQNLPDIGFFPEGGYLITGLKNKIAVKIKDADLDTPPILGIVEDADGNKITDFQTFEFGLGYFYLTPEPGKEYNARISSKDENILYSIPLPLAEGYVMNTSISDKDLTIEISTNKKEGLENILLIGHQRGIPVFDHVGKANKKSVLIKVPKTDLAEGVLDLVLFNDTNKPVAERLVYVQKPNEIKLSVRKTNGNTTQTRDRVDLKIDVRDLSAKVVPSSLSVSITNTSRIDPDKTADNIRSYLLLNSDLRGKIKSPNYFFTKGDEVKKNAQLDLIMMTHGWRRFDWLEFLERQPLEKYKPEDGIYISGRTINAKPPYQNKISETKMAIRQKGFYQEEQITDQYGQFSYGPYVFVDTVAVLFQAGKDLSSNKPELANTNVIFDPPKEKPRFMPDWTISTFNQVLSNKEKINRTKARNAVFRNFEFDEDRELLDEVLLQGKLETKEEIAEKKREKRTRSFEPSHRIIVDEMGKHGGGDFLDLLGMIPGLSIRVKVFDPESVTPNQYVIHMRGLEPSIYLDNVKVSMNIARSIAQADIDFIDIMNTGQASAAYGLEAQGVIAIYSKQGSRSKGTAEKLPGSITFQKPGFYSARTFYAPDYSKVDRNNNRNDDRATLYWNPKLTTEAYKKTEFTFYTSDDHGPFQVEVQGITDSGIPFFTTSLFEVD